MWEKETIDIGVVGENTNHTIVFKFTGNCSPVNTELYPSCGCSSANWNAVTKELSVQLSVGEIPQHLPNTQVTIHKSVKMNYICAAESYSDILNITGILSKLN